MTPSLMQFPCDFSIKVIGKNTTTFQSDIITITRQHYPDLPDTAVRTQLSRQGAYCSIQVTVYALDQVSLDALYRALTAHPDAQMVL